MKNGYKIAFVLAILAFATVIISNRLAIPDQVATIASMQWRVQAITKIQQVTFGAEHPIFPAQDWDGKGVVVVIAPINNPKAVRRIVLHTPHPQIDDYYNLRVGQVISFEKAKIMGTDIRQYFWEGTDRHFCNLWLIIDPQK